MCEKKSTFVTSWTCHILTSFQWPTLMFFFLFQNIIFMHCSPSSVENYCWSIDMIIVKANKLPLISYWIPYDVAWTISHFLLYNIKLYKLSFHALLCPFFVHSQVLMSEWRRKIDKRFVTLNDIISYIMVFFLICCAIFIALPLKKWCLYGALSRTC